MRLHAVLAEAPRKRPAADAENARRAPLVAACLLEHPLDVPHLDVAERGQRPTLLRAADALGQVLDVDTLAAGAHRGLLDGLAQLAEVPGPRVVAQRRFRL